TQGREPPQHTPRQKPEREGPQAERVWEEPQRDQRSDGQREQGSAPGQPGALRLQAGIVRGRAHLSTNPSTTSTPTAAAPTAMTGATQDEGSGSPRRSAR